MTTTEILHHDLEAVCYHEAGHLVALLNQGGNGFIRIDEAADTTDLHNQKSRAGRVIVLQSANTDEGKRIVGIAGAIAETLLRDPYPDEDDLELTLDDDLSPTDSGLARVYTHETIETALRILRDNWDQVQHYAGCEIGKLEGADYA